MSDGGFCHYCQKANCICDSGEARQSSVMPVELEFWHECMSQAADECKVTLTGEQLDCFAESAKVAHENYGMAFYQPESPYPNEIKKLEKALAVEKAKVVCPVCKGGGSITTYGGTFQSTSSCWKCQGEGRITR